MSKHIGIRTHIKQLQYHASQNKKLGIGTTNFFDQDNRRVLRLPPSKIQLTKM